MIDDIGRSRPTAAARRRRGDARRAAGRRARGARQAVAAHRAQEAARRARRRGAPRRSARRSTRRRSAIERPLADAPRPSSSAAERAPQLEAERLDLTEVDGRPPARGHLHLVTQTQRPPRGRLRRHGLHRRRGPRGRDRLVQLRGAQLPGRPPGPRHVRHALRRPRRARSRRCCAPTRRRCRSG